MGNEGKIKRLKEFENSSTKVKLMFIYPETKPIFRQGYVKNIFNDCFEFEDRYEGVMTFGFEFLQSIEVEEEK